jgi:hypothetical protein
LFPGSRRRAAKHALDNRVAKARRVVVKMEMVRLLVEIEAVDAVGVGKLSERAELLWRKTILQFVGSGHQCHARDYSKGLGRR